MQPFDALTIRAVLHEAKPIIINRKVDKVLQLGRDEILLSLRSKAGMTNLLLSAQTAYGRICLVRWASTPNNSNQPEKTQKPGHSQSNFALLLKRHLTGAVLLAVEQPTGERTVDFVFSCTDEVGAASLKILTAEVMGRHSNLIFWDKATEKIIAASHVVTKEMSRQREVAPGLRFVRPPGQDKPSIFEITNDQFAKKYDDLNQLLLTQTTDTLAPPATVEQWLISSFTGIGRHLAEELVAASGMESSLDKSAQNPDFKELVWRKILALQKTDLYKPAIKKDLSRFSILSWWPELATEETSRDDWKTMPSVNDMVDEYFRSVETREQFQQLRERLRSEVRGETEKLEARLKAASAQMSAGESLEQLKKSGDLILANISAINNGQETLICDDLYQTSATSVTIKLNPNLNASQNAQSFYRQYAKSRARQSAASTACAEAQTRLESLRLQMTAVEQAKGTDELRRLKDTLIGRKQSELPRSSQQGNRGNNGQQSKQKPKSKILSVTSSDGWTIYVGRNRQENDHLLSRLAQPNDLWLHILGQGGAHVLIRVPASKQEPPLNTIKEAAQIAARLSKASTGTKVRVVYTQCKHVKKIAKDKPGLVRYENEKTLEVDTAAPMPKCMKQLFSN